MRVTVIMTLFCVISESESESESDDDSHTVTIQEGSSTRSDRRVGHWPTRYADFVQ